MLCRKSAYRCRYTWACATPVPFLSKRSDKWQTMESGELWDSSSRPTEPRRAGIAIRKTSPTRAWNWVPEAPEVDYCAGWHDHPLFIQTWAELIQASFADIPVHQRLSTDLVFTAHSLPTAMAARSPYVEQLETSARLVAAKLGHERWSIAYQSRSGKPTDPWLEPDIGDAIRKLAAAGLQRSRRRAHRLCLRSCRGAL